MRLSQGRTMESLPSSGVVFVETRDGCTSLLKWDVDAVRGVSDFVAWDRTLLYNDGRVFAVITDPALPKTGYEETIEEFRLALVNNDLSATIKLFERVLYEKHEITVASDFAYWHAVETVEKVWDDAKWDSDCRSYGWASEITDEVLKDAAEWVNTMVTGRIKRVAAERMQMAKDEEQRINTTNTEGVTP